MGKKRNTAKTGDKALYKSRQQSVSKSDAHGSDNDAIYTEVDRFHNSRDEEFLKFGNDGDDDGHFDDGISGREGVLDLGGGESSSSEDDETSDNDDDSIRQRQAVPEEALSEDESSSDSEEDELGIEESDVRDWGKRKSAYYHGDTADLEIGQDEEDAFLEEEAAKEVQAARYKDMEEDDFVMSDAEGEETPKGKLPKQKNVEQVRSERDLSKLSRSERRRLLKSHHPELLPLVSHFSGTVREWRDLTRVVETALLQGDEGSAAEAVGATQAGLQLLIMKSLVQSSTALNVAMYCLLKSEQANTGDEEDQSLAVLNGISNEGIAIQSHPVVARLHKLNSLEKKLEDRVESKLETLPDQYDNLVKASALVHSVEKNEAGAETSSDDERKLDDYDVEERRNNHPEPTPVSNSPSVSDHQLVLNEAKFALRVKEIDGDDTKTKRKRRSALHSDYGDDEDIVNGRKTTQLASTINAIEQRSSTKARKRRTSPMTEDVGLPNEDDDAVRRGLEMMEAELGRVESDDDADHMDDGELEGDEIVGKNDFYSQVTKKSKAKKKLKKELYQVAPKYPGLDEEVDGERAISRQIMKNRGLVAHKSKLNRNPRVKKREQYRKALVRRKGAVREVRTDESHKYGGEETGIKSGLSRSRKLGV